MKIKKKLCLGLSVLSFVISGLISSNSQILHADYGDILVDSSNFSEYFIIFSHCVILYNIKFK